jgi:5-methyltetrahydrofolate--homocysteine methyltransferase
MITIVGNSLDSCNKKILDKMNKMDMEFIKKATAVQLVRGAQYIELNAVSLLDNEIPFLREVIPTIEGMGGKVLVRSENIETLIEAAQIARQEVAIGDIEYNLDKINVVIDLLRKENVKVIASIKESRKNVGIYPERSLLIAQMYVDYLLDHGISRKNILLNPEIRPLEENFSNGRTFLNTLELLELDFPQIKTISDLTILSDGLPRRHLINSYFLSLAIEKGLDYIVLNVMEKAINESIVATLSIIGKDRNMHTYLDYCRNKKDIVQRGY